MHLQTVVDCPGRAGVAPRADAHTWALCDILHRQRKLIFIKARRGAGGTEDSSVCVRLHLPASGLLARRANTADQRHKVKCLNQRNKRHGKIVISDTVSHYVLSVRVHWTPLKKYPNQIVNP